MRRWTLSDVVVQIEPVTTVEGIDEVLAIEESSFTNPWTREMYLSELQNTGVSFCFLARDEAGLCAGFCSFWRVLDELHINNLAVRPDARRAGPTTRRGISTSALALRSPACVAPITRSRSKMRSFSGAKDWAIADLERPPTLWYVRNMSKGGGTWMHSRTI